MKKITVFFISTVSAIAGFSLGYYASERKNKKLIDDIVDEKINEELKSITSFRNKEKEQASENELPKEKQIAVKNEHIDYGKAYRELAKSYTSDPPSDRDDLSDKSKAKAISNECDEPEKIYIINEEDFAGSLFDAVTLFYFSDGILSDTYLTIINNHREIIGSGLLTNFGMHGNDGDVLYIRNELKSVDYEVLRQDLTYREYYKNTCGYYPPDDHPRE